MAFDYGKSTVKLYFMSGLPTETDEDILGIARLAEAVAELYYKNPHRQKGVHPKVTISVSCFIPKPFTPFQWEAQDSFGELERKAGAAGRGDQEPPRALYLARRQGQRVEAALAARQPEAVRGPARCPPQGDEIRRVGRIFRL